MKMHSFEDQVVLVTGGARGMGRSHALAFARAGAKVALCDVAKTETLDAYEMATDDDLRETVAAVEKLGAACHWAVVDVRRTEPLNAFVRATIERFGRLDVLCANAGKTAFGKCTELSDEAWEDVLAVNLTGAFKSVRAVLPQMIAQRYGRIVVIGSSGARMGLAGESAYVAAKWGLIGFIKSVALEVATLGVTLNAVCPTVVNTGLIHNPAHYRLFRPDLPNPKLDDVVGEMRRQHPQGIAWIEPAEISAAVLYLASKETVHITGETLSLTAGLSALNVG
jgi:NAD(P)-dependent dehydrogenase (short-subunit alcohol dehydrogenase family)